MYRVKWLYSAQCDADVFEPVSTRKITEKIRSHCDLQSGRMDLAALGPYALTSSQIFSRPALPLSQ